ncbi:acyl-CoA carboxylase epsilon subunit [Rhodococcus sp. HNM0569]|uniref:acyl-CoA carboxylase epsilon subunit n=1 Tax=Rhodococcus sp. HNM0569 TaxID=2716340 RepID=UPI00146A6D27|nr:acyl-CoA carboxylase epsilon subunit [Rhodococcus sp. HNM0569]NLU81889.1 acyl-CoA carboxylase subunit epsilon [Rhodococcus sp. HNM0569]
MSLRTDETAPAGRPADDTAAAAADDASTIEVSVSFDPAAADDSASSTAAESASAQSGADAIRIVKGAPTDEDIAALVAVLSAAAASSGPAESALPPELWGSPTRMHRVFAPTSPYSFPNVASAWRTW